MKEADGTKGSRGAFEFDSDAKTDLNSLQADLAMNTVPPTEEKNNNNMSFSSEKPFCPIKFAAFFAGHLACIFVVPIFALLGAGFAIGAVLAVILGILRTFKADLIPMRFLFFSSPSYLSLPLSLLVAVVFGCIALGSWIILRRYLNYFKSRLSFTRKA